MRGSSHALSKSPNSVRIVKKAASIMTTAWTVGMSRRVIDSQARCPNPCRANRSEEHTSELQSLMRSSFAVFCLKKRITTLISAAKYTMTTHTTPLECVLLILLQQLYNEEIC